MPDSSRTLGDIEDIDSAELRTQLKNWIEEEGIEANIQLQMKKNLIEKMSRTALGKKIALKLQTQHGIVLSPLVLVLNTLVAEFLYTQNCHFSLSIFTNEVPFKNTLPDFTRTSKFRLNRTELGEIFEALGIEHYTGLVEKYEKFGTDQGSRSLLYIVFQSVLSAVKTQETKLRRLHRYDKRKANARTLLKQLEVEKLHRNVGKLLHRVKSVGKGIAELEKANANPTGPDTGGNEPKVKANEDDESTVTLRVCSENVSKLVERLESCTKMFERLLETVQHHRKEDDADERVEDEEIGEQTKHKRKKEKRKSYTDFLHELKTTEHGKRYVAKLQKQVAKLLDKEKLQIEAKFKRELWKLEQDYKQRLEIPVPPQPLEVIKHDFPSPQQHDPKGDESEHFMQKIDEKLDQLYRQERNVDDKLATLRNDLQRQEQRQSRYFDSLKAAKTKENKLQVLHNVERELMATFEDETNAIIQNAKQTIEQLEKESDKINHSFQRYLRKQREDKRKLIDEKVQIWSRYNDEKLEFNQRELLNALPPDGKAIETCPITPDLTVPVPVSVEPEERGNGFENPFRSFDPLKYLKNSRPIESHTVDVGIATISDTAQQTSREEELIDPTPTDRPVPAARTNSTTHLSNALAKDTRELRKSIEGNLQKLDQMSRTYSKSNSSSEKRTFDIVPPNGGMALKVPAPIPLPTVEATSNRSLDDCSSTELGLSDGEVILPVPGGEPAHGTGTRLQLNSTQDLLDYASQNIINEHRTSEGKLLKPPMAASYSDLSMGTISEPSKLSYEKSQSFAEDLDRISTGARSNATQNSWT